MSPASNQIAEMIDMLPEKEQSFAVELMKKLILAWDPDFTKLTPTEAERLRIGKRQFAEGESFSDAEIDWDALDSMDLS